MNKKILVDFDGVLNRSLERICSYSKKHFGHKFKVSDLTQYSLSLCTPLTDEQIGSMFADGYFYKTNKPNLEALEAISNLSAAGYEINIITARPHKGTVREETLSWLAKYKVPIHSVHITPSNLDKIEIAKGLGLELFVEDRLDTALLLAKVCSMGFLIDQPHNQADRLPTNLIRVKSMKDVYEFLMKQGIDNE
jgi:hypothetical protein